jgi:hypothetical protein
VVWLADQPAPGRRWKEWRKSSASGGLNDEACVEVAPVTRQEATDLTTRITTGDIDR